MVRCPCHNKQVPLFRVAVFVPWWTHPMSIPCMFMLRVQEGRCTFLQEIPARRILCYPDVPPAESHVKGPRVWGSLAYQTDLLHVDGMKTSAMAFWAFAPLE